MRQIKFRAWDGMRYTTGLIMFVASTGKLVAAGNAVIEQFTGLKDASGKEIYEGDIVQIKQPWQDKPSGSKYLVEWNSHGCWEPLYGMNMAGMTIIGNIHENPGLMK